MIWVISRKILTIIVGILIFDAAVGVFGYYTQEQKGEDYEMNVVVTIPPQKEFVQSVGGDKLKVTLMVPPGQDPHSYEPKSSQMREVAKADIYFKVGSGIDFEKRWMDTIKEYNPNIKIIDGSDGIDLLEMGEHSHEDNDDLHEEKVDPHIWMSPLNAVQMVNNFVDGLVQVDQEDEDFYRSNSEDYISDLMDLHGRLEDGLDKYEGEEFLVFHPSFGYLAAEYNLTQVPIQEEGKDPGTKRLQNIIDQALEEEISVVFVSPQFDKNNADTIAEEINGRVLIINPLDSNYIDNIRDITDKLISGFEEGDD